MCERARLVDSIAKSIRLYRKGEIPEPNSAHVERWIQQFTPENQVSLLKEVDFTLINGFITEDGINTFLGNLVVNEKLTGGDPASFWKKINFLSVQQAGVSQLEMLKLLGRQLESKLGLGLSQCGDANGDYIYLDDIMCTGTRVGKDLEKWIINEAPQHAKLHVVLAVTHSGGAYYLRTRLLKQAIERSGKTITIAYWRAIELEDRLYYKNNADVLWPAILPERQDVKEHVAALRYPFEQRVPGGSSKTFTSEQGRQIMESEMLIAGIKILSHFTGPKGPLKPLGFSKFGLGFGSTLVTYRNCPNTAPLAFWWGEGAPHGALQWYPLLPRKTYSSPENVFRSL